MGAYKESSSFRDPSGFLFYREDPSLKPTSGGQKPGRILFRQVNVSYKKDYTMLMESGLYTTLVEKGYMIPHEEVDVPPEDPDHAYKILKPRRISFISYPYEWCFSQLKDAALLTLEIQRTAFDCGMSLKDASVYNIQFENGRPIFIDTLSFEQYREGEPWIPYRQFCQHFLAPLALMSYRDIRFGQFLKIYIDGIPLDFTSNLLPFRTKLKFSLFTHIHLHAKSQKTYEDRTVDVNGRQVSPLAFCGIIESLYAAVQKLEWKPGKTVWGAYYENTNYTEKAFQTKKEIINQFIMKAGPRVVWDLGANTGIFSRIAGNKQIKTIAFDRDPGAVELNYRTARENSEEYLLPLLMDLTNPSPGTGWENTERASFIQRGPADLVMALALIHHLAIANNVPLPGIARFFHTLGRFLIIEFIPKEDSQVKRLLSTRDDVFPGYTRECFEHDFSRYFTIVDKKPVAQSKRILYLMQSR
jgi:ribosomal protein L11 methylase PrmA